MAPPTSKSSGLSLGFPSSSTIQPWGIPDPRALAKLILPAATADVAMSMKKGPSKSLGIAIEIGFVPSLFSFPPNGTTALADLPESAVIHPIMSSFAAIVEYAPSLPI